MSALALQATGLTRTLGDVPIVRGASLALAAGETVALVGPSGCGKTTLLQMLALLDRPSAGRVVIAGEDAWAAGAAVRQRLRLGAIGFVFQKNNLLPHLSALDNVALPAWRCGGRRGPALVAAARLLESLGLAHRAAALARTLSVGEAQRVAIARALVNKPALVLADEPTGSLDSAATAAVLGALEQVRAAGAALLVVTHDLAVAARFDRRLAMADGVLSERLA